MDGQNQSIRPIETQLETFLFVLYYLNRTCGFHFNSASIESLCNETFVVWMLFNCLKMRLKEYFSHFSRICLKLSRKICWKYGILLKIKSTTNFLIKVCRSFSEQKILRIGMNRYFHNCFNSPLDLNFKWR